MSLLEAIILGIVQGLTEFLPVSSSGHLVLWQNMLGLQEPGLTLEIMLHFGTLVSVFWVFGRDFIKLVKFTQDPGQKKILNLLIVGTIPTGLIGWTLGNYLGGFMESPLLAGIMLLLTGFLVYAINLIPPGDKTTNEMTPVDGFWIGILQGISVIPGISRSGATVFAALSRNLDRYNAVKYSFMLAVPAILGASVLELKEFLEEGAAISAPENYLAGGGTAFIFGVIAIKYFINMLQQNKFSYFAFYCWMVGLLTILLSMLYDVYT